MGGGGGGGGGGGVRVSVAYSLLLMGSRVSVIFCFTGDYLWGCRQPMASDKIFFSV